MEEWEPGGPTPRRGRLPGVLALLAVVVAAGILARSPATAPQPAPELTIEPSPAGPVPPALFVDVAVTQN